MINIETESLMRMMLGLLVFRLGGEQVFTIAEIDEIRQTVQGVQIFVSQDGDKIILRSRGPEKCLEAIEKGNVI